jgi:eukaryotic-like serine/threonine-protein kinase
MMPPMSGIPAGAGQLLGKRLGKFEILALLALGGTAEIYLARIGGAAGFEKYVVVKCLHDHLADDAEFVKMFLDEARLAAHLDHSNIVQTMELGQHEGRYYMVMEFLAGLSLAMIVRRATERLPNARIPIPLVLNILAQSAAGLHYAHDKAMNGRALNIVHRDISPQNLVISFEGVVKVVDFGIAKAELRETRTRSGTIKGKFAYMSPEQCVAHNVDRRTDVFALGVIGHELLTGRRLFKRPSPYETYQAVIDCDVKPPSVFDPQIDAELDAVLMRALTKDKEVRYPTAEAFGDALAGYLHHRGIGSGPGDVSRFFDTYFGQELDEHAGRMRELISGRDISVETGVNWNGDDGDDEAKRDAAALGGSLVRESGDIEELARPTAGGSAHAFDDELGTGSRVEDDDEMPAERTRIESNPLERINELERAAPPAAHARPVTPPAAKPQARAQPPAASQAPPKAALQAPPAQVALPTPPPAPSSSPAALPPRATRPPRFTKDGRLETAAPPAAAAAPVLRPAPVVPGAERFPDLANLPTMIAIGESIPADAEGFGNAPTNVVPSTVPEQSFSSAPTHLAAPAFTPPAAPPALAPPTAFANAPTRIAPLIPMVDAGVPPGPPPVGAFPNAPTYVVPSPMGGYPVMNAQLRGQIETGATVFPSAPSDGLRALPRSAPPPLVTRGAKPNGGFDPGAGYISPTGSLRAGPTASFELSGLNTDTVARQDIDDDRSGVPPSGEYGAHALPGAATTGPYGGGAPSGAYPPNAPSGAYPPNAPSGAYHHPSAPSGAYPPNAAPSGAYPPNAAPSGAYPPNAAQSGGFDVHGLQGTGPQGAPGSGPHGAPGSGPQGLPGSGAHGLPGSGVHGLPPSGSHDVSGGYPRSDSAGYVLPSDGAGDAQRAANLMSPVGRQYPERVDWATAAATRARAVPPWLLGILFVAAIGIALALTVVIARAIR